MDKSIEASKKVLETLNAKLAPFLKITEECFFVKEQRIAVMNLSMVGSEYLEDECGRVQANERFCNLVVETVKNITGDKFKARFNNGSNTFWLMPTDVEKV